jgi:nitrite reductase/ring-hydroxylating ferredoxin subunit
MATPYYYLRVDSQRDHDVVIFGGADHKTGQSQNPREHFAQVERTLLEILPDADITHRWSGQVIETRDRLPYIGEISPGQFVMTGFSGNGLTFGTLGAMMARDAMTGQPNPWRELFDVNRTRITKGLGNYLTENKDYAYYLIRDRFAGAKGKSLRTLRRGTGGILEVDGKRVAAYRDEDGTATLLSPKCTHLGCEVAWNDAESSWDCPCHGSRFTATGKVMGGPAEEPLSPAE